MLRLTILLLLLSPLSFYSLTADDIDGNNINFNDFQGKKVLIVNIASNSEFAAQFQSLEQLQQQYKDSLVVIAFPSNSFNNEPENNMDDLKYNLSSTYSINYLLGYKVNVTGNNICPVYQWLTQQEQNGMSENVVENDFQKFLISKDGRLVGIFAGSVDAMSEELTNAIEATDY